MISVARKGETNVIENLACLNVHTLENLRPQESVSLLPDRSCRYRAKGRKVAEAETALSRR
jgi:hypothetical protein